MSAPEKKEEKAPERAGPGKLPLLLVAVLALGAGAALGFLALPRVLGKAAHAAAGAAPTAEGEAATEARAGGEKVEAGEPAKAGAGAYADRIVQFDPFVVNVSGENYPRYLKLQVVFEMRSVEAKRKLEERIAPVRDLTISLLSSKRLADITDFEGKALLKDDLRNQVDEMLGKDSVESVLFTEFVVQ